MVRGGGGGGRGGRANPGTPPITTSRGDRGSCWIWGLVGLFVLAVVGITLFVWAARNAMINQVKSQMTTEEYAEMEEWLATEVDFPEEWANPEPYSATLAETINEIRPVIEYWMDPAEAIKSQLKSPDDPVIKKLREEQNLSEEDWGGARELREEARPLLEAVSRLLDAPDYEIGAFALLDYENDDNRLKQNFDYDLFNLIAHRIELEGSVHARDRNWDEAFREIALLHRLSHRHPACQILGHLIGTNTEILFAKRLQNFVTQCDEPDSLKAMLNEIETYQTGFPESFLDSPFSLENIGYLRNAARLGYEVDLTPGQTNASYLSQFADLLVNEEKADPTSSAWETLSWMLTPIETIYQQSKPDYSGSKGRFLTGEAAIRLARLGVASRIRELEVRHPVTDLNALVPDVLPAVPEDPFSENAFLWDASSEIFYSVGPDLEDDGNLIPYSPTNGVVSKGDYSLK